MKQGLHVNNKAAVMYTNKQTTYIQAGMKGYYVFIHDTQTFFLDLMLCTVVFVAQVCFFFLTHEVKLIPYQEERQAWQKSPKGL